MRRAIVKDRKLCVQDRRVVIDGGDGAPCVCGPPSPASGEYYRTILCNDAPSQLAVPIEVYISRELWESLGSTSSVSQDVSGVRGCWEVDDSRVYTCELDPEIIDGAALHLPGVTQGVTSFVGCVCTIDCAFAGAGVIEVTLGTGQNCDDIAYCCEDTEQRTVCASEECWVEEDYLDVLSVGRCYGVGPGLPDICFDPCTGAFEQGGYEYESRQRNLRIRESCRTSETKSTTTTTQSARSDTCGDAASTGPDSTTRNRYTPWPGPAIRSGDDCVGTDTTSSYNFIPGDERFTEAWSYTQTDVVTDYRWSPFSFHRKRSVITYRANQTAVLRDSEFAPAVTESIDIITEVTRARRTFTASSPEIDLLQFGQIDCPNFGPEIEPTFPGWGPQLDGPPVAQPLQSGSEPQIELLPQLLQSNAARPPANAEQPVGILGPVIGEIVRRLRERL